jgi:hypothetical protein
MVFHISVRDLAVGSINKVGNMCSVRDILGMCIQEVSDGHYLKNSVNDSNIT